MKEEYFSVKVVSKTSVIQDARIRSIDFGTNFQFDFLYGEINLSATNDYPFFALEEIRLALEKHDIVIICEGSRIDVSPSGMQLDSFFAYELELYKPATKSVFILDSTEKIEKIGSVEEQRKFYNTWLESVCLGN